MGTHRSLSGIRDNPRLQRTAARHHDPPGGRRAHGGTRATAPNDEYLIAAVPWQGFQSIRIACRRRFRVPNWQGFAISQRPLRAPIRLLDFFWDWPETGFDRAGYESLSGAFRPCHGVTMHRLALRLRLRPGAATDAEGSWQIPPLCSGTLLADSWHLGSAAPSVNSYPSSKSQASVSCGPSDWPASPAFTEEGIFEVPSPRGVRHPRLPTAMALEGNPLRAT